MKFTCEKALLQAAISTTSRAVSPKSSIPALEGILLEAGSELRLTGYNLETGIRTIVPADIQEQGTLVLSARLFGEIIRKLPDDIVILHRRELYGQHQVRHERVQHPGHRPGGVPRAAHRGVSELLCHHPGAGSRP